VTRCRAEAILFRRLIAEKTWGSRLCGAEWFTSLI
jgi:hypothetical protein